jgi:hypothetical protein
MGGFGSGNRRYGQCSKRTTDDMRGLDVRTLHRGDWLKPGAWGQWTWTCNGERSAWIEFRATTDGVVLSYRQRQPGGDWRDMEYLVRVEWTPCHYGGTRPWWLCPAAGCGRRVALLFGGAFFACRHCHRLAYASTRESEQDRAMRRADTLRKRLGWEHGILNGSGGKPKGMHWRTYFRLHQAVNDRMEAAFTHMDHMLDRVRDVEEKLMRQVKT